MQLIISIQLICLADCHTWAPEKEESIEPDVCLCSETSELPLQVSMLRG